MQRARTFRIAVAALGANLLMLIIFLRAVVAALYLLAGSILSPMAALGLTMLVFSQLEPGVGLTFYVPFAAAVLLLAFGSAYNIFTVGTIWDEARHRSLPDALVAAMPSTIAAIFVAGLALAGSFGLLGVVPLLPFRQLAFAMSVGIALDVLVVRSILLPAMLTVFGTVSAWAGSRLVANPTLIPPRGPSPRTATVATTPPHEPPDTSLDLVAAVVLENNGTLSVVTKDKLGSGSALDGVPGWAIESG